jgi:hypothetical protein
MSQPPPSAPLHAPLGALEEGEFSAPLLLRLPAPHPASSRMAAKVIANSFLFMMILLFRFHKAPLSKGAFLPGVSYRAFYHSQENWHDL